MSEPNEAQNATEATDTTVGTETQPQAEATPSDDHSEAETFPRSYVEQLRHEAAEHRVRAQRADRLASELLASVKQTAAGDVLRDAGELPEDGDYLDADGMPDPAKIRAAAEALAQDKPWLARVRGGENFQGPRLESGSVSLGALLRDAAR